MEPNNDKNLWNKKIGKWENVRERERESVKLGTNNLNTLSNQSLVRHDDNNDDIYLAHSKRSSVYLSSKWPFVCHIRSVTKQ